MTKEITKAVILQEIQDKFKLRDFEPEKFLFAETVVPIYDIGQHLKVWESYWINKSVTGTGALDLVEVPKTEKWLLRAYSVTFMSGAWTIAGVYILRVHQRAASDFSYLDLTAAQSTAYLNTLPTPVVLEPGDKIMVNVDGYTSTGNLRLDYDFMREEIR